MGKGWQGQERRCAGDLLLSGDRIPLYLLTVFGKGEKANLTLAERNVLAGLVEVLKRSAEQTT